MSRDAVERTGYARWFITGLLVTSFAALLTLVSGRFGYDADVIDMPVLPLVAGLVAAGVIFLAALARLMKGADAQGTPSAKFLIVFIFAIGLAARLVLMASEPILEDDYQRYLWDGAVAAEGLNPYLMSPDEIRTSPSGGTLQALKDKAGLVFKRINHKDLTTIYPPLTQAAFALASKIAPFNLTAWRGVLLIADVTTFALLLLALDALGRTRTWSALYWWNPVLLKEVYNSAHFEVLIFPFLLAALLFAFRRRPVAASAMLGLGAGIKLWPAILLPLILRPFLNDRRSLVLATGVFAALMSLWLWPLVSAGLGDNAGISAYAASWSKNGPVFAIIHGAIARGFGALGLLDAGAVNLAARAIVVAIVGAVALCAAWRPIAGFDDLSSRALLIVAVLVVCSPAVYPWYTLWFLPLLVLRPEPALLALTATIPIYYAYFHFAARETTEVFHAYVMWLIWLPVLALYYWQRLRHRERPAGVSVFMRGG